ESYSYIGQQLYDFSQIDGAALAAAWEEAKATLGLVRVEVPDGSITLESIQEQLGDVLLQRFMAATDKEVFYSPEGELQTVWIEGEQVWSSAAVSGLMAENLNDKIAGAAFRDNLANEEATYNLGLDAIWGEIQSDTDARFYAAMWLSNARYADDNAASVMGESGGAGASATCMN